jgi:transposase-like protein
MSTWKNLVRWTEDDASAALAALERSGLSVACFADREGVDAQRLYKWRRRLGPVTDFVEVTPSASLALGAPRGFEVMLGSGRVVRVPESFDAEALRRLIAVLEAEC